MKMSLTGKITAICLMGMMTFALFQGGAVGSDMDGPPATNVDHSPADSAWFMTREGDGEGHGHAGEDEGSGFPEEVEDHGHYDGGAQGEGEGPGQGGLFFTAGTPIYYHGGAQSDCDVDEGDYAGADCSDQDDPSNNGSGAMIITVNSVTYIPQWDIAG